MTALTDLQAEVRAVNELNGWFDTDRPFSADVALLHTEITELDEAIEQYDGPNIAEELADILIRLLDTVERREIPLEREYEYRFVGHVRPHAWMGAAEHGVRLLHRSASHMYEGYRNGRPEETEKAAREILIQLTILASDLSVVLRDEVDKKLARNRERGYRHGGKVE